MATNGINEQVISTNGVELHVATAGDPSTPALLLLHGLYDRWETWDPVIRALSSRFQVVAPDLRGHARSSKPKSGYTPQDYAEDCVGLLDELGIDEVVVVGHSLGALVSVFLAGDNIQRVRSVVLVDPPFEQNEGTREWLQILLDAKRAPEEETYATVKELNILSGDDAEWQRQTDWLHATADGPFEELIEIIDEGRTAQLYEVLHRVTCPTLILQADPASGGALSDAGADLALSHLNDGTRIKFDQTGHSPHLERTEEFVQVVSDFLERSV